MACRSEKCPHKTICKIESDDDSIPFYECPMYDKIQDILMDLPFTDEDEDFTEQDFEED